MFFLSEITTWTICDENFNKRIQLKIHLLFIHDGPYNRVVSVLYKYTSSKFQ